MRITYTLRWEDYKPLMAAKNSENPCRKTSFTNFSPRWITPVGLQIHKILGYIMNLIEGHP